MNRITAASMLAAVLLPLFASCAGNDGTGRQDWPLVCPNPSSNKVKYAHATWGDRGVCSYLDFFCPDADDDGRGDYLLVEFPDRMRKGSCGCGCYYPNGDKPDWPGERLPEPEPESDSDWDTGEPD